MDAHNRHYCGKCRYTEYKVKEKPAEAKLVEAKPAEAKA
jgi:hypothetical protein